MAATAVRPSPLGVVSISLAFLYLLASPAAAAKDNVALAVHSHTNASTSELHASVLPDGTLTGVARPTRASSHRDRPATSASATPPNDNALDVVPAVAREETTTTAPATTCASSCPCVCVVVQTRDVAVEDIVPAPGGITEAAATRKAALLRGLPLLAVRLLPKPLAALVVLSALAPSARAGGPPSDDDSFRQVAQGTCTVYRYLPADGTGVDRSRPLAGVRPVACGACQGEQIAGPFRRYCHVRTLEIYNGPGGVKLRVLNDHPPLADPDAVVAASGDVCYVEMEHLNYREGYYILCPVRQCPRLPFLCCSGSPHDAVVWERRNKLTNRGVIDWGEYSNRTAMPSFNEA